MSLAERLYARLPVPAQHLSVSAYGLYWRHLRFGGGYRAAVRTFRQRSEWDADRWRVWRRRALQKVLRAAAHHVPHYAATWSESEKQAARDGDLQALPMLEKEPIRSDPHAFVDEREAGDRQHVFHTSGTTGTPIASLWTARELRATMAVREARSNDWAGTSFDRPRATFSGRSVVPVSGSRGPFHRYNLAERQVYFSAFHLSPATAPRYVAALRRHRVQWLTGYAVSWYLLARSILDQDLEPPPLRAVITTSEKTTPEMRRVMEEAYGCPVFEEYSTVENVLFASECPEGSLHVSPDVGEVEILRADGSASPPGEVGEVVATSVLRRHQPMVRFRLGDLAAWRAAPCACGSALPALEEVVGRLEDVLVGPDGRELVRFHGVFVGLPTVVEGQVVQVARDRLRLHVVAGAGYDDATREELTRRVRHRMGEVEVEVEVVDRIPRDRSGKFRAVISELSDGAHRSFVA